VTSAATGELFARLLSGEAIPWTTFQMPVTEFLEASSQQRLTGLIFQRIGTLTDGGWPREIREALASEVRAQAATELVQHKELVAVIELLAAHGIFPIVLKGTAFAYSLYETPSSRPRLDTDLLIRQNERHRLRELMSGFGYASPPYCDGDLLFGQFPLMVTRFGLIHRFDCHWKISTQPLFANLLTYDEVDGRAVALPALGAHGRTLAPLDALLLACVHPTMHHRNAESLLWSYDVHLLASSLSVADAERFVEMAIDKQVATICLRQLKAAQARFATRFPESSIRMLAATRSREPTAVYLRPDRRWSDELWSGLRALSGWTQRVRLLREIAFPSPAYMLGAYGCPKSLLGFTLLPILYGHRLVAGLWKVVIGRK
jgi:hypothetical protein